MGLQGDEMAGFLDLFIHDLNGLFSWVMRSSQTRLCRCAVSTEAMCPGLFTLSQFTPVPAQQWTLPHSEVAGF